MRTEHWLRLEDTSLKKEDPRKRGLTICCPPPPPPPPLFGDKGSPTLGLLVLLLLVLLLALLATLAPPPAGPRASRGPTSGVRSGEKGSP